jgi:hypothetical protein
MVPSLRPLLLAVIFILISACGDRYKIFRLTLGYKETEQVDAHADCVLLINKVEENRLMIMENVPQNGELTLFLYYCFQQLLENRNVPIEMWNVNKHRHRTNSVFRVWDSKLNSIAGKQQTFVFPQVQ